MVQSRAMPFFSIFIGLLFWQSTSYSVGTLKPFESDSLWVSVKGLKRPGGAPFNNPMLQGKHPSRNPFLTAIDADLDDDSRRLVYADFLEEEGHEDYARFIRLQCALASQANLTIDQRRSMVRETQLLLKKNYQFWLAPLISPLLQQSSFRIRRGFVDGWTPDGHIDASAPERLAQIEATILNVVPSITHLKLSIGNHFIPRDFLHRVTSLELHDFFSPLLFENQTTMPHLHSLSIVQTFTYFDEHPLNLFGERWGKQLKALRLVLPRFNNPTPNSVTHFLSQAPHLVSVEFDQVNNGHALVERLFSSVKKPLQKLVLRQVGLNEAGVARIVADQAALSELRWLSFSHNELPVRTFYPLLESSLVGHRLEHLDIRQQDGWYAPSATVSGCSRLIQREGRSDGVIWGPRKSKRWQQINYPRALVE